VLMAGEVQGGLAAVAAHAALHLARPTWPRVTAVSTGVATAPRPSAGSAAHLTRLTAAAALDSSCCCHGMAGLAAAVIATSQRAAAIPAAAVWLGRAARE
jgi:hypothetical protein